MDRTGSGEENMEEHNADSKTGDGTLSSSSGSSSGSSVNPAPRSPVKLYCDVMQPLQFDSYGFLVESGATDSTASMGHSRFAVAYHFENAVRAAGEGSNPNRMKRLAQETATLTTSLPLSTSPYVFARCYADRLDIMKITDRHPLRLFILSVAHGGPSDYNGPVHCPLQSQFVQRREGVPLGAQHLARTP